MGLNIESNETPHAENLNAPNDVYIYFQGGFYVWNWQNDKPLYVWFNNDCFTFNRVEYHYPKAAVIAFNSWTGKQALSEAVPVKLSASQLLRGMLP